MESDAAAQVDSVFNAAPGGLKILCADGGTNDLFQSATAATVRSRYITYGTNRLANGEIVIIGNQLPAAGGVGVPAGYEAERQALRTAMLADFPTATAFANIYTGGSYATYFIDFGGDTRIGDAGDNNDLTYFSPDKIHLNNTGYGIWAQYYKNVITLIIS